MTDRGKEHLVFDIVVPGLLFVACILAALLIMAMITTPAKAHCPPGTTYGCIRDYDGKQVCGCH